MEEVGVSSELFVRFCANVCFKMRISGLMRRDNCLGKLVPDLHGVGGNDFLSP